MKKAFRAMVMLMLMVMLMPPLNAAGQSEYTIEEDTAQVHDTLQGLVSLDFKDADLKDVLKVFSQQSGLNFVAAKSTEEKKITLYMEQVMVEDALRTLLEANNLGLEQSPGSNIIIVKAKTVAPVETMTRVYRIRYYHGSASPGSYLMKGGEVDMYGDFNEIIEPLLSQYGSIVSYGNVVIITDIPEKFPLLDQIISEIDQPIAEVMIEVELIETTSDFLKQVGVKWGQQFLDFTGSSRTTKFPLSNWDGSADMADAQFNYGLISANSLSFILEALRSDTNTKFLSKPRILVQDREWAEIRVTSDQIVSVKTIQTTTDGETSYEVEVERMEVGTILKLLPLINAEEGLVSMMLEPSISRPTNSTFVQPGTTTNFIDPQLRSMRTVVMVRDHETVVVGGFITTEEEETITKVPWLGDIPFIGSMFRHSQTDRVDKELLIFITPKIVRAHEKVQSGSTESAAVPVQDTGVKPVDGGQDLAQSSDSGSADAPVQAAGEILPEADIVNDLPFREQDGMKMDMVNGVGMGAVELVK